MGRKATTLDEQVEKLRSRGMIITDADKAKEVLLDVGYYRLGFYWFPNEKPAKRNKPRLHEFLPGADFDDAVKLYYFDYALRNILLKYITRIEVNFRNFMVYVLSNRFPNYPAWFVNSEIVAESFIETFDKEVYNLNFKRNKFIATHHRLHPEDKYAPAWKTLEFMTFGSNIALYKSLNDIELKKEISIHFGVGYTGVFENYLDVVRCVRNKCAHGAVLYDIDLFPNIRKGPAGVVGKDDRKLYGALQVVRYLLSKVSENRAKDFDNEVDALLQKYITTPTIKEIISRISGFKLDAEN